MQIESTREIILAAIEPAAAAVESRQTMPVLGNLVFRSNGEYIQVVGGNSETEIRQVADIVCGEFATTIPAKKLVDIVRALSSDAPVKIDFGDNEVVLRSKRSRYKFTPLPADQYPTIDQFEPTLQFTVAGSEFARQIQSVQHAMARQDVRYFLNGLLVEAADGHISLVATDGHRAAALETEISIEGNGQVIVPNSAVSMIVSMVGKREDEVSILMDDRHIQVAIGKTTLTSKLIDGKFPDYERAFPANDQPAIVKCSRIELIEGLQRVLILAAENRAGRIVVKDDIQIWAGANSEEAEETVDADVHIEGGGQIEFGLNINYLMDAAKSMVSDFVYLSGTDSEKSWLVTGEDDAGLRHVVSPLRL